jgi:hypothetical protein
VKKKLLEPKNAPPFHFPEYAKWLAAREKLKEMGGGVVVDVGEGGWVYARWANGEIAIMHKSGLDFEPPPPRLCDDDSLMMALVRLGIV